MKNNSSSTSPLILLAEDDDDFFFIIKCSLELAGFRGRLELVQNLRMFKEHFEGGGAPDLIIIDFGISPNYWRSALEYLKKEKRFLSIPLVILSADHEGAEVLEEFPKCFHVLKPHSFEDWKACMEEIIRTNL